MSTILENQPRHDRYVISAGHAQWLADENQLLAVTEPAGVAPLPLCDASLHGILSTQYGPLALLALTQPAGPAPALAALVLSDKGPVALAVDHVGQLDRAAPSAANSSPLADGLALLTHDFSEAKLPHAHARGAERGPEQVRFLLIEAGPDVQVAVRASRVSRIERCQELRPVRGVGGDHQVVQAGGQLLHAQSLSSLLGLACDAATPSWCLQMHGDASATAVLVSAIAGSIEAPADAIHTVEIAGRPSHWLMRPDLAPLEIVLEGVADQAATQPQGHNVKDTAQVTESGGAACQALRVDVGPYAVVIPQEVLGPVTGQLQPASERRTQADDVRVWHLDRLLGLHTTAAPTHAFVLQLARHSVLLLCGQIQPVTSLQSFAPVPSLPKHLADLLQGVRIADGTAELLLSSNPTPRSLRALLRQRLRLARAGWMPPVWNHQENRTDHAQ